MADQLAEVLKHRYVYVPRGTEKDTIEPGKLLGLTVARGHGVRLTVVCAQRANATHHKELAKLEIVTERSGHVQDGGVVLAWCPTYKVMDKIQHLETSVVVLIEWIPGEFDGWAKLNGAYNVVTGKVMESGLSQAGLKALEAVVFEGYNGWHDHIAETMTIKYLGDLSSTDGYDRELVLAYARRTNSGSSVERLKKILDKFEATIASASAEPAGRTW